MQIPILNMLRKENYKAILGSVGIYRMACLNMIYSFVRSFRIEKLSRLSTTLGCWGVSPCMEEVLYVRSSQDMGLAFCCIPTACRMRSKKAGFGSSSAKCSILHYSRMFLYALLMSNLIRTCDSVRAKVVITLSSGAYFINADVVTSGAGFTGCRGGECNSMPEGVFESKPTTRGAGDAGGVHGETSHGPKKKEHVSEVVCAKLREEFSGIVTDDFKTLYCYHECGFNIFMRTQCNGKARVEEFDWYDFVKRSVFGRFIEDIEKFRLAGPQSKLKDPTLSWFDQRIVIALVKRFVPFIICTTPALVSSVSSEDVRSQGWFMFLVFICMVSSVYNGWGKDPSMWLSALGLEMLGIVYKSTSGIPSFITSFNLIVMVGLIMSTFGWEILTAQLVFLFIILASISKLFYNTYAGKAVNEAMLFMVCALSLFVAVPISYELMGIRGAQSLIGQIFQYVLSVCLPTGGGGSVWINCLYAAGEAAQYFEVVFLSLDAGAPTELRIDAGVYFGLFMLGPVLHLLFRALIGWKSLHHARVKGLTIPLGLYHGFWAYATDIFNTPVYLIRVFFGVVFGSFKLTDTNNMFYHLFVVYLTYCEFYYGREMFLMRVVASCYVGVAFKQSLVSISRELEAHNLSSNVMEIYAFGKVGAFPAFSWEQVSKVINACYVLRSGGKTGVCLVRSNDGIPTVYTVSHVVDGQKKHVIKDVKFNGTFTSVGYGADPVVSLQVVDSLSEIPGCDIPLLHPNERPEAVGLLFVHPDRVVNFINKFKFVGKGPTTEIEATFNAKSGDSGSPILAVMSNGALRLAGVVCKGSVSEGSGNFIAVVGGECHVGDPGVHDAAVLDISVTDGGGAIAVLNRLLSDRHKRVEACKCSDDDISESAKDVVELACVEGLLASETFGFSREVKEAVRRAWDDGRIINFNVQRIVQDHPD